MFLVFQAAAFLLPGCLAPLQRRFASLLRRAAAELSFQGPPIPGPGPSVQVLAESLTHTCRQSQTALPAGPAVDLEPWVPQGAPGLTGSEPLQSVPCSPDALSLSGLGWVTQEPAARVGMGMFLPENDCCSRTPGYLGPRLHGMLHSPRALGQLEQSIKGLTLGLAR